MDKNYPILGPVVNVRFHLSGLAERALALARAEGITGPRSLWTVLIAMAALGPVCANPPSGPRPGTVPTSWGRVKGSVYDASTGAPIVDARVVCRQDRVFAETGKTTATTDARGAYRLAAMIGRASENFDLGRALSGGIAGLIAGGATNKTRRIDVVQQILRVTATGYKTFEGLVPCVLLDPNGFSVTHAPIILVPERGVGSSFTDPDWGIAALTDVAIQPSIAEPGQVVELAVAIRCPIADPPLDVVARSEWWGSRRLKRVPTAESGLVRYSGTVRAPKPGSSGVTIVTFRLEKSDVPLIAGGGEASAMAQVVVDPSDRQTARARAGAYAAMTSGNYVEATALWQSVCSSGAAELRDWIALAQCSASSGAYGVSADAWARAVDLAPKKLRPSATTRHAEALLQAGNPSAALARYGSTVMSPGADPDKIARAEPPEMLAALGWSALITGDLPGAIRVRDALDALPQRLPETANALRAAVRVEETRIAAEGAPTNAALQAAYGRALLDTQRWEEAQVVMQRATALPSALPSFGRDAAYAAERLQDDRIGESDTRPWTLDEAREQTVISDGEKPRKSSDFWAWHRLAMLLMREMMKDPTVTTGDTARLRSECIQALEEAVLLSRAGGSVNEGLYAGYFGFLSPRVVSIAGYAYPEAAADFILLSALRDISADAEDPYARFCIAETLTDLREYGTAQQLLAGHYGDWSQKPDYLFLEARISLGLGRRDAGLEQLRRVVALNPRSGPASLLLGRVLMENGDGIGSGRALAEYADYYGAVEPPTVGVKQ